MPIVNGEHPGTDPALAAGHNKFLGLPNEGHRGVLLGLRVDRRQAVVLAKTKSSEPASINSPPNWAFRLADPPPGMVSVPVGAGQSGKPHESAFNTMARAMLGGWRWAL